eukprot:1628367-Pyramimonas_sp.AAC.1
MGPRNIVLGGGDACEHRMRRRRGEERNAGRCLFKTRTQHNRMVGKNTKLNQAPAAGFTEEVSSGACNLVDSLG